MLLKHLLEFVALFISKDLFSGVVPYFAR